MARVFVIPDVHLKPWIFDEAADCLSKGKYDYIVCLGDLVDDWGMEYNLPLYEETLQSALRFAEQNENALFCYGNHDVSYVWQKMETGYSSVARPVVVENYNRLERFLDDRIRFVHQIDNVLFSHAGLTLEFVEEWFEPIMDDIDAVLKEVNTSCHALELWRDNSPIWARPQFCHFEMYPKNMLQVVGHTPVESPILDGYVLSVDTFSTYRDGTPIGNQRFVWIDTDTRGWGYVDK